MSMINVTLKDNVVKQYEKGTTAGDVTKDLSMGLYRAATSCIIDGKLADLRAPLEQDCSLEIITFDNEQGKKTFWHTASHVLAQAVKRLYPTVKLAIGPAIDNGFYYDIDCEKPFTTEDLVKIEKAMKDIIKEKPTIERFELSPAEAIKFMEEQGEIYKVELIKEHADNGENISFYKQGDFVDLCAGPHLMDMSVIKAVKLLQCTGAYWRGDANNTQLVRVYGTAYPKASQLEEYLTLLEEAKKRDHRKLGKELELFALLEEGPGFPFFLPKGMEVRNQLTNYWREIHHEAGYQEISSPIILNQTLWENSGHWDHYKDNMYTTTIDDKAFAVKPMNCPGGMLVYKNKMHSYKDLPLRLGELGLVHRHELSGALHGLMRVRNFTQDDAHIFMTKEQIKDEIQSVVRLIDKVYKTFGFEYHIELSTQPEDSMGAKEDWDYATDSLREAIVELGYDYKLNEGDGAFYGPKLDFHLRDCIGRTWQCGTIQLDFQMPERFELEYTGADGAKHRPIMIHRVVFGSIERFIGILIEQFAGAFPLWLAPVQVKILPIGERQHEYALQLKADLFKAGIRVELDDRNEKIGYKIREAQLEKIPYMFVLGDKEVESNEISVRSRRDGDKGSMTLEKAIEMLTCEIKEKTN